MKSFRLQVYCKNKDQRKELKILMAQLKEEGENNADLLIRLLKKEGDSN